MTYDQMIQREAFLNEFKFTGMCEETWNTTKMLEMKKRAKLKYKGYKTRIMREDGYSSIYVEKSYFKDQEIQKLKDYVSSYNDRKEDVCARYDKELDELKKAQDEAIVRLESYFEGKSI